MIFTLCFLLPRMFQSYLGLRSTYDKIRNWRDENIVWQREFAGKVGKRRTTYTPLSIPSRKNKREKAVPSHHFVPSLLMTMLYRCTVMRDFWFPVHKDQVDHSTKTEICIDVNSNGNKEHKRSERNKAETLFPCKTSPDSTKLKNFFVDSWI